jgi:RNA recognition motif-containing protein
MQKKHEKEDIDPFLSFGDHLYHETIINNELLYYHLKTKIMTKNVPPIGSSVRRLDALGWYDIRYQQPVMLDPHLMTKKFGPVGSNLFLFHLPNDTHELEIFNLFRGFGNILSVRIMK